MLALRNKLFRKTLFFEKSTPKSSPKTAKQTLYKSPDANIKRRTSKTESQLLVVLVSRSTSEKANKSPICAPNRIRSFIAILTQRVEYNGVFPIWPCIKDSKCHQQSKHIQIPKSNGTIFVWDAAMSPSKYNVWNRCSRIFSYCSTDIVFILKNTSPPHFKNSFANAVVHRQYWKVDTHWFRTPHHSRRFFQLRWLYGGSNYGYALFDWRWR